MSSNKKSGDKWKQTRHDKYYWLAKEQGFRSRAAFKLIQLNKKYNFLGTCKAALDLCAAPGGWLQVASKYMPVSSLIVGVDLLPIKPIPRVRTLQEDITSQKCRALLKKEFAGWDLDVVLHDGAPSVGGSTWHKDAFGQMELVMKALALATQFLRPGGTFVTKVFRSQDYNSLLWVLKQFFKTMDVTKPPASRNASAEIFVVCQGYLAPKKIDPRLLDPNHVFEMIEGPKKKVDVFNRKEGKRNRAGYDEEELYRKGTVAAFVEGDDPIGMLGSYSSFQFDSASQTYLAHAATNEEVKALCTDLKVLNKGDFKTLLKWRKQMREFRQELLEEKKRAEGGEEEEEEEEEEEKPVTAEEQAALAEQKAAGQLEELQGKLAKRQKRELKKRRELKAKLRKRLELNANNTGGLEDGGQQGLFSLGQIRDQSGLETVHKDEDGEDVDLAELQRPDSDEDMPVESEASDHSGSDSEEDYYNRLEASLDVLYDQYKSKREDVAKKRRRLGLDTDEPEAGATAKDEDADGSEPSESGEDEEGWKAKADGADEEEGGKNPLMVDIETERRPSKKQRINRWFDRDLFEGIEDGPADGEKANGKNKGKSKANGAAEMDFSSSDEEEEEKFSKKQTHEPSSEDSDADDEESEAPKKPSKKQQKKAAKAKVKAMTIKNQQNPVAGGAALMDEEDQEEDGGARVSTIMVEAPSTATNVFLDPRVSVVNAKSAKGLANGSSKSEKPERKTRAERRLEAFKKRKSGKDDDEGEEEDEKGGFEVVPADDDWSSDSDAQAEVLALGTAMLRKKNKERIIESGYNRYAFHDEDLPDWFADNENLFNKASMPITKQEVDAFKEQLKAINARPMKKIAEAKARKKQKTLKRWEKIKAQADVVANSSSLTPAEKLKSIQSMYKKAKPDKKKKKERVYVVSKKGGGTTEAPRKKGAVVKRVDPRMKKEVRAMKRKDKQSKKGGGRKRKRG